ncbi:hypothetical protein BSL82_03675 [Tardibacter chloracetimidivorans]|uniref:Portal protein n=1 Tax=Tardibacter chloracetimidivorans TaxID=1921510 RepID=A0A1L3ZSA9_9SPHN|nr:hypothetical protein [Tardibacter chloracetimidivorans]API58516.1 hypothetical protein BSL82_03675 [Tardibacter chloracetimidivorans]
MKNERIRPLTEDELLNACRSKADAGSTFVDTNLADERRKVTEYYLGQRPYQAREGGSKFVSQDVYLSVETMKAEIVETFGAGSNIVTFSPQNDDDVPLAKQSTAYCEYVVHRQNRGLEVFQDVVHDGLTNRVGLAKVYWDRREIIEEYSFENITQEQAIRLLMNPQFRLKGKPTITQSEDGTVLLSGEVEEITDASQVVIEPIPPEEFIKTGRSRYLDKADYLAHRYRCTLGDLVDDGYDADLVYSITGSDDDLAMDAEKLQREEETTSGFLNDEDNVDEAGRMVTVYESYIRIDFEGTGRRQLWKVVHVGEVLLEKQKVNDHPFVAYVPQPIPHTFYGNNFAARTIQHANTKTVLARAVIEQAVDATNPRWMVARGGVANPRELIDNRRGGVVNVRSLTDSVAPLPSTNINPFVPQVIQMVDSDREDTTGISRLSQGLDKKALSHQNSQGLVQQLTENSQGRTKIIARNFALQFVSQLYLKVYQLAIENETEEKIVEIAGSFVRATPSQWRSRRDVAVDMTLGYGARDQAVEELLVADKALSEKQARWYGDKQSYNVWKRAMEIKGWKNIQEIITDPDTLPPPEPNPLQKAELDEKLKNIDVAERQMALRERQVEREDSRKDAELAIRRIDTLQGIKLKSAEQARKDRETDNRIDIGLAELDLAIEAQVNASPENTRLTAIASPNS